MVSDSKFKSVVYPLFKNGNHRFIYDGNASTTWKLEIILKMTRCAPIDHIKMGDIQN